MPTAAEFVQSFIAVMDKNQPDYWWHTLSEHAKVQYAFQVWCHSFNKEEVGKGIAEVLDAIANPQEATKKG
jgi:hypothetical protein